MEESIRIEDLLKHSRWMKALAKSLIFDDNRAQDIVQQAWLAALKTPPRSMASARSWLGKVVRNFALRSRQEEGRRHRREILTARPERSSSTPQELLQRVELQREVADMVTRLEEPLRSTVLLRFFEDLPVTEIARRQGIPATTVSSRLSKALDLLRARLDRRYRGNRKSWCLLLLALIPTKEALSAAAAPPSAALPGAILKGLAMKTSVKVAVVLVPLVLSGAVLTLSGVLPPGLGIWGPKEEPMSVSFRPLARHQGEGLAPAGSAEADGLKTRLIREALPPTGEAVPPLAADQALLQARIVDEQDYPLAGACLAEVNDEGSKAFALSGQDGTVELILDAGAEGRIAHVGLSMLAAR